MTSLTRRAPALLLALFIGLAGSLLGAAPSSAAASAATDTVTYSINGLGAASLSAPATTITTGQSVAFKNTDTVALTVSTGLPAKTLVTVKAGATSAPIVFSTAGTTTYTAGSSHASLLGLVPLSAVGTVTVKAPTSSAPTSGPTTPAPGSQPTVAPTSKAPTSGSGGSGTGGSGGSGSGGGTSGGGGAGAAAATGGASAAPPVTPPTTPPSILGGFAPGDFGALAPQAGENGAVLPPVIAPYATITGPDGVPSTLYETYTPTPSPVAAVSAGSGGGTDGRAIGLTGAVTAVLLVGLVAAFGRLLLGHPAAAARRH